MSGASLERGIHAFKEVVDAPVASFFSACVRCGLCAHACLFYTETGDPQYTPIHKLEPLRRVWQQEYTFWGRLASAIGLSKPVSDEELGDWESLVYDSCTLCGRCSMICPARPHTRFNPDTLRAMTSQARGREPNQTKHSEHERRRLRC